MLYNHIIKQNLVGVIMGPVGQRNGGKEKMIYIREAVKGIYSNNLGNLHFQIKTEIKDMAYRGNA